MKYESPSLELMGEMAELTGSCGFQWHVGDVTRLCEIPSLTPPYCTMLYCNW